MKRTEELLVKTTQFPRISDMFKDRNIGSTNFHIISGPCSVESVDQLECISQLIVKNNLKFMRGGLFKPRTSPYDFQGLHSAGYKWLKQLCEKYSLISVSEIMDTRDVEEAKKYIDVIQIGSRNMQNTALLKEVGQTRHPILLKRGMMSSLHEFLMAAEYIVVSGNKNIILCERGIRTFENSTRNTLDFSSVAIIKKETSLPIIIDISHSLGRKDIILPVAKAAKALGVDGIMVEVHNNPPIALSDSEQQLTIDEFQMFYDEIRSSNY